MPQLDSDLGSAETLLELCWRAAAVAAVGNSESHGLAVDRKDLRQPYWLSNVTMSTKLERRAYANIEY